MAQSKREYAYSIEAACEFYNAREESFIDQEFKLLSKSRLDESINVPEIRFRNRMVLLEELLSVCCRLGVDFVQVCRVVEVSSDVLLVFTEQHKIPYKKYVRPSRYVNVSGLRSLSA